ncbi:ribonuclease T2 family protein [Rhizobium sp. Root482]|uniref:ribonuclease T2 family protein n=1 Tax=Rhizobium sp. Root482 TaxID=1736543 RepID=UPI0009E954F1|nr:ribonuclease [Rhizobium sp. Root482]
MSASAPVFRAVILLALALPALVGCNGENENTPPPKETPVSITPIAGSTPIAGNPTANARKKAPSLPRGSGFDFYVLSLSWSPSWCLENDPGGRTMQCSAEKDHGFIVHGFWPQNEQGYPEFCRTRHPDRVPDALGRSLFDIMPSMGLIGHEWRKHGTCSGLGQKEYFALLRAAREKLAIPPALRSVKAERRTSPQEIEAQLTDANPGLGSDGLAVTCDAGRIDEVRICFEKDLSFRACREIDRAGCRLRNPTLPATP